MQNPPSSETLKLIKNKNNVCSVFSDDDQTQIYLGDRTMARDFTRLQELGIAYIINITVPREQGGVHNFFQGNPPFEYLRCPVPDTHDANIYEFFEQCIDFIDQGLSKGYSVLVHCQLGISRSPTVVLAYLMKSKNWSLQMAYSYLKNKRPSIKPRTNFLSQLLRFEKSLKFNRLKRPLEVNDNPTSYSAISIKSSPENSFKKISSNSIKSSPEDSVKEISSNTIITTNNSDNLHNAKKICMSERDKQNIK